MDKQTNIWRNKNWIDKWPDRRIEKEADRWKDRAIYGKTNRQMDK